MAQFDTEYQRLEASYSDSPPGEEDLLVHVPEGSKCEFLTDSQSGGIGETWRRNIEGARGLCSFRALTSLLLCPTAPWHHIENLDLFFSRISFVSPCWSCGTFRPSLSQAPNRKLGCIYPWRGMELFLRLKDVGK